MDLEQLRKSPWFKSSVVSVIFHMIILTASAFIYITGSTQGDDGSYYKFHMKGVTTEPVVFGKKDGHGRRDLENVIRFESEEAKGKASVVQRRSVQTVIRKANVDGPNFEEANSLKVDVVQKETDIRNLLSQTQEKEAREKVAVKEKSTTTLLTKLSENMVKGPGTGVFKKSGLWQNPLSKFDNSLSENVALDPEEGMPGFTPAGHGGSLTGTSDYESGYGSSESRASLVKYDALDNFMDIAVYTYEDPASKQKYFMIKIFAKKESHAFSSIPKEIIFAVDASLSIRADRLNEFKKGIRYCLSHLNQGDVFNVVAFKDTTSFLMSESVPVDSEMIKKAERFIANLDSNQRTDVYLAFKKIIEKPLGRMPSNVVLISDGRPTHGIQDSRELIQAVTRANKKKRPVFVYSGGIKVNRYLLDFLAYQNRGWSQFTKEVYEIDKGLEEFYDKIKDPIFINLRYRLSGMNEADVFPRSLPDFYKNAEFTLYGTYHDEDNFSMQLLGDVAGQTKELIFTRSLKNAQKGHDDIMKGYAFNRIYYLISQMTVSGPNSKTLDEIQSLSQRYGIVTPYSPELEKMK